MFQPRQEKKIAMGNDQLNAAIFLVNELSKDIENLQESLWQRNKKDPKFPDVSHALTNMQNKIKNFQEGNQEARST